LSLKLNNQLKHLIKVCLKNLSEKPLITKNKSKTFLLDTIRTCLCSVHGAGSVGVGDGADVRRLPGLEGCVGGAVHAAVIGPVCRTGVGSQVGERVIRCVGHIIAV